LARASADECDLRRVRRPRGIDLPEDGLARRCLTLARRQAELALAIGVHREDRVLAVTARHECDVRAAGLVTATPGERRGSCCQHEEERESTVHGPGRLVRERL